MNKFLIYICVFLALIGSGLAANGITSEAHIYNGAISSEHPYPLAYEIIYSIYHFPSSPFLVVGNINKNDFNNSRSLGALPSTVFAILELQDFSIFNNNHINQISTIYIDDNLITLKSTPTPGIAGGFTVDTTSDVNNVTSIDAENNQHAYLFKRTLQSEGYWFLKIYIPLTQAPSNDFINDLNTFVSIKLFSPISKTGAACDYYQYQSNIYDMKRVDNIITKKNNLYTQMGDILNKNYEIAMIFVYIIEILLVLIAISLLIFGVTWIVRWIKSV